MSKFTSAALTAVILAGLQTPCFAQTSAPVAPQAPIAPTVSAVAVPSASKPLVHNGSAFGSNCHEQSESLEQLKSDVAAMRAELSVMHQLLTDMQAQQKPAVHSVADVPGK